MLPGVRRSPVFGTSASLSRWSLPSQVERLGLDDALAAAHAADGYARATGEIAILATFGRDEALSAASAIPLSWGDRIPLLALSLLPEEDLGPVGDAYAPVVRTSLRAFAGEDVSAVVARLEAALAGGVPAHLVAPEDVDLARLLDGISKLAPAARPSGPPAHSDLVQVASAVRRLRRPVILFGVEAVQRADFAHLAEVARRLQCPVLLTATVSAMSIRIPNWELISSAAPLLSNPDTAWLLTLRRADGILALGTSLSEADLFGLRDIQWHRGRVFCVGDQELGPEELCEIRIRHDPGDFLAGLAQQLADELPRRCRARWQQRAGRRLNGFPQLAQREARRARTANPLDPAFVAAQIVAAAPVDAVFLAEGNASGMWLRTFLGMRPLVFPVLMGNIGIAIPWAAGVHLARARHPLWGVLGDGGFLFQPKALGDLTRLGVPAVFFVFNDSSWNSIRLAQTFVFRRHYVGTALPLIDYAELAQLHGCEGLVVTSAAELEGALRVAGGWHEQEKRPLVVDVRIAEDSIPLAGSSFALTELDCIWGPLKGRIVAGGIHALLAGRIPSRNILLPLRLFLMRASA